MPMSTHSPHVLFSSLLAGFVAYAGSSSSKCLLILQSFIDNDRNMRKLKYHEKKLLKKVNFLEWKREGGHREAHVMHRYHITGRDDYKKYISPSLSLYLYLYI